MYIKKECSFEEALYLVKKEYDFAENLYGDEVKKDKNGVLTLNLKDKTSLDLNETWICFRENLRDEYWVKGNTLECRNGNIYKVKDKDNAVLVKGSKLKNLYRGSFDLDFDYGVHKEWNIKYVLDENEKIILVI